METYDKSTDFDGVSDNAIPFTLTGSILFTPKHLLIDFWSVQKMA
jgi:hypothetical protein